MVGGGSNASSCFAIAFRPTSPFSSLVTYSFNFSIVTCTWAWHMDMRCEIESNVQLYSINFALNLIYGFRFDALRVDTRP